MTDRQLATFTHARQLYGMVRLFPGKTLAYWSRRLDVTYGAMMSRVISAEGQGFLFYEDDGGQLFPFKVAR